MKFLLKLLAGIVFLPPIIYGLASLVGALIPVNSNFEESRDGIEIFIQVRGTHTDLVLPYQNEIMDWSKIVSTSHTKASEDNIQYISFGWGDLEFYRTTPQWEDLTLKTAFRSLFLKTPAALHLEFWKNLPPARESIRLKLDESQYNSLVEYIKNDFQKDENGEIQPIPDLHYHSRDAFYPAKGSLSLCKTCNTWANSALRTAGIRSCLWTAFPQGIIYQVRN